MPISTSLDLFGILDLCSPNHANETTVSQACQIKTQKSKIKDGHEGTAEGLLLEPTYR
jgi:hypothetical protein